jgi:alkanesulfonate monooxygenase SsuD/methylene tetrahydromethanopterin reductase-like flavin-dependent oxidoreductase (luciferase family)
MRFGIGYWSMAATRLAPRSHVLLYDELVGDAIAAEKMGFEDIWVVEHHFWYDGHCNAGLVALASLAGATSRIGLGPSCLLLPLHDPLRVAEMAALLDQLSGGRVRLVLGLGYRDEEYDGLGIERHRRVSRLEEGIEILRRAWAGRLSGFSGRQYCYGRVDCPMRPTRADIPIALAGFVPATAERAARLRCGLMLGPVIDVQYASQLVDRYYRVARETGFDPADQMVGICRDFWIARTSQEARETAIPRLYHYYGETVALGWKLFRDESNEVIGLERPQLLKQYVDAAVSAAIVGDPDTVYEELAKLERMGFNYVRLRFRFDSLPQHEIHQAMRLFALTIMPDLARAQHEKEG